MSEENALAGRVAGLDADLERRSRNLSPHADLPVVLEPGSNVEYLAKAEHDRVMAELAVIARGLGRFGRPSEHDHRLALERSLRPR